MLNKWINISQPLVEIILEPEIILMFPTNLLNVTSIDC